MFGQNPARIHEISSYQPRTSRDEMSDSLTNMCRREAAEWMISMNLYRLLEGLEWKGSVPDQDIPSLTCDSRQVEPGSLFFCIKGGQSDGHDFAKAACEAGAAAVVVERDLGIPGQILVGNSRLAYSIVCGNYFGNPARKMKLVGITGTNGKTTTTYLIKHILETTGAKVGLIGTIQIEVGDQPLLAKYTTPDPYQLHTTFAQMEKAGCEYVVMEVSSHSLDQNRVAGLTFEVGVFTNLTQDHLDYHGTMENYYQAKRKLFDHCRAAVVDVDDAYGKRLAGECPCPVKTYSVQGNPADYMAGEIVTFADGSAYILSAKNRREQVKIAMPGAFSVANATGAAAACLALGMGWERVLYALSTYPGVKGRLEVLPAPGKDFTILRDYAHSPDGLEKMLTAVRNFAPGRILCLFGPAGCRDRTKRPKMGKIVATLADFVILTSDNPRTEDPQQILNDTLPGILEVGTPYKMIVNRYDAIEWALHNAQKDDILVLAGKGHEDYQVLDYGTIYFDEKEVVARLLAEEAADAK